MTRVDFYILPLGSTAATQQQLLVTLCKLCEKCYASGALSYVLSTDFGLLEQLDQSLWTFRDGSFLPHERYAGGALQAPLPPILLGAIEPPDSHLGILLNLDAAIPPFFSRFERVLEIVPGEPSARTQSRERFRFYRERGYELNTHNL